MSTVHEALYLGPGLAGTLMRPEEFDAATDCDRSYDYQLINGVLIVNPPPEEGERFPNDLLGHILCRYQEEHPEGKTLNGTAPEHTVRTRGNRRRADRAIWAGYDQMPDSRETVPTIVVEFVSASFRDRRRGYE